MSLLLVNKTFMVLGIIDFDIINGCLNFVTRSRTHSIRFFSLQFRHAPSFPRQYHHHHHRWAKIDHERALFR